MPASAARLRDRFQHCPLVLDGAMGTELERRGVAASLPLWSAGALLSAPEVVGALHAEYVAAGADLLVANTFRTNARTLRRAGHFDDGPRLNGLAIRLARQAAAGAKRGGTDDDLLVAASVAPVEDCYCPERVPDDVTLRAEHAEMLAWLAAAGPDLVWIETMNTLREARAVAAAAADHALPLVISFVVQESGDLLSGEPLEVAIAAVETFKPLAIGLNCVPPRGLSALLPRLRRATTCPLAAYAHIGNRTPIRGWSYAQDVTPAEYAEYARQWLDLGAAIIGGCCGTTPAHVRAVRESVDRDRRRAPPR